MNWLFPAFLAGGAAIALPILLHILRSKPQRRIVFPTLRFLGPTAVRQTRRHRLLRWIVLVLRCLVITLLALAFARPYRAQAVRTAGVAAVVVVDNSFSMQAAGRWSALRGRALAELGALQPGDRAGLLVMHPTPGWLVPLTDDLDAVRQTLMRQTPGFTATRYNPALRLAARTLEGVSARRRLIIWMGDHQRLGWNDVDFSLRLPPGVEFAAPEPPAPAQAQAAVMRTALRPRHGALALEVAVRLYTLGNARRTLTVTAGGQVVAARVIDLSSEQPATLSLPLAGTTSSVPFAVRVTLDADDLPADDTAYAVWEPRQGPVVLLAESKPASGESDFLAHALAATALVEGRPLRIVPLPRDPWPPGAVAVLRGDQPFQSPYVARLETYLAQGGRAWLCVDGSPGQQAWLRARGVETVPLPCLEAPRHLRNFDTDHPLIAAIGGDSLIPLLAVDVRQAWTLKAPGLIVLAEWADRSPALAELAVGRGTLLISGFPATREGSTWPLQPFFVPHLHQTILWLADTGQASRDWRVGDTIPLPESPGRWVAVDAPQASEPLDVRSAVTPLVPGLYRYEAAADRRLFAVNLATGESDLTPWPQPGDWRRLADASASPDSLPARATRLSAVDAEQRQRDWWWLMAAVGVLLIAELGLANRTAS